MVSRFILNFAALKLRWLFVTTTDIGNIRPYRVHLYDAVVCQEPHLTEKSVFADTVSTKANVRKNVGFFSVPYFHEYKEKSYT